MKELDRAIIKTLAYADLFGQALAVEELHRYLLGISVNTSELHSVLQESQIPGIGQRDGLVFLQDSYLNADHKPLQQQTTDRKLKTVKRYAWLFKLVPWVRLVCVTGSVAGGTPTIDDDIDVLVVSSKRRLWLTRFLVTGLISLTGKRRRPEDNPHAVNNKLCLNMWLSDDRLATDDQNMYVANELAHMVPIVNKDAMYERYIAANEWVREVLPNFYASVERPVLSVQKSEVASGKASPPFSIMLDWIDMKLERWQRGRMRKVTRETVEDDLLMFHPRDYGSEVMEKFHARLEALGVR